jgi:hypothetical protein
MFQVELEGSFDSHDVLYVPGLKNNLFSISTMEGICFAINFQRGKVLICLEKYILDNAMMLRLERELYTGFRESLFRIWYMTMTTYVSCGT